MRKRGYENSLDRADWLRHSFTIFSQRESSKALEKVSAHLVSACRISTDPDVIRAFERYQAAKDRLELFKEEGDDDDGIA